MRKIVVFWHNLPTVRVVVYARSRIVFINLAASGANNIIFVRFDK